jgi:hypothetical protein
MRLSGLPLDRLSHRDFELKAAVYVLRAAFAKIQIVLSLVVLANLHR